MRQRLSLLVMLVLAGAIAPAPADDTDLYLASSQIEPNVVILIDTSGSMTGQINGQRKIDIAKTVVSDLIDSIDGVRFGVFAFNSSSTGGKLVAQVGTPKQAMIDAIDDLDASGNTPLGRTALDIQRYYRGEYSERSSGGRDEGDDEDEEGSDDEEDEGGGASVLVTYPSPIQFECQANYVILMTDGMPTGEDQNLVATTALSMFTSDHSSITGMQEVVVHTIGFAVPEGTALLTQTAQNGGGNFYTANNYAELEAALTDAIETVIENVFAFAMPMIPTTSAGDGARAYMATFRPSNARAFWQGFLAAYTRDGNGQIPVGADGQPDDSALVWEAGDELSDRASSGRTINTWAGGSMQSFVTTNATITRTLLAVATDTIKNQVVQFVRGVDSFDTDRDGDVTEDRSWKLGDIVHSVPVLVGAPPLLSADPDYHTFRQSVASRPSILLVGANDGMLHAFRASDGYELWGFIPPDLLDDLQYMTGTGSHRFYADATPIVSDVKLNGSWKTVAVFGTRRGGRTYHALDITDTSNPVYLWGTSDGEMGETWSEPTIGKVKMADGSPRWVAIVGGGFHSTANNTQGRAVYAIDLSNGSILWKYSNTGSADSRYMNFSIPANVRAVDLSGDGYLDRLYVGDIGGQLWKFDVSTPATLSGGMVNNWSGKRLFVASPSQANPPASGEYHPARGIYATPVLAYDELGELWVFLGTGDRNHPNAASSANRIYGIKDNTDMTNGAQLTEASLVNSSSGSPPTQGWYVALGTNEKIWTTAELYNAIVYFSSYTPEAATTCESVGGYSRLYALQMANGHLGLDWTDGDSLEGTDGSEQRWTDAGNGAPTAPEVTQGSAGDGVMVGNTEGEITNIDLPRVTRKRLRYWREVF